MEGHPKDGEGDDHQAQRADPLVKILLLAGQVAAAEHACLAPLSFEREDLLAGGGRRGGRVQGRELGAQRSILRRKLCFQFGPWVLSRRHRAGRTPPKARKLARGSAVPFHFSVHTQLHIQVKKKTSMDFPPSLLEAALVAGAGINAVLGYSFAAAWLRRGAPFVPTATTKVRALFGPGGLLCGSGSKLLSVPAPHVVDLGSGGGTLVRAAVREAKFARATGIELNPALVAFARLRSHGQNSETFHLGSFWEASLADADVVLVYGVPSIMAQLELKLVRELKQGSIVISNAFPFVTSRTTGASRSSTSTPTQPALHIQAEEPAPQRIERRSRVLETVCEQWVDTSRFSPDESSALYVYRVVEGPVLGAAA